MKIFLKIVEKYLKNLMENYKRKFNELENNFLINRENNFKKVKLLEDSLVKIEVFTFKIFIGKPRIG